MIKTDFQNMYEMMTDEEKTILALRSLYKSYGYDHYSMSKFEEYDLYARNKDFLISDNIITFTDTNGRLMALKPDVTLSIIKNSRNSALAEKGGQRHVQRMFYNENVYRVAEGSEAFKEIMQTGLELIGEYGPDELFEVIMLAAKSLEVVSDDYILDISNLDIVAAMINSLIQAAGDGVDDPGALYKKLLRSVSEKNVHECRCLCDENGISNDKAEMLAKLMQIYGKPEKVLPELKEFINSIGSIELQGAYMQLESVIDSFNKFPEIADKIRIDFSVVSNTSYYNGLVFKGFVAGIPESIISGGQYDNLMKKMKQQRRGVGFAMYMNLLERLI